MAETSKTADQALSALLEVSDRGPVTAAQLARDLGLNRTVVQRLLTTLHNRGFVARDRSGYVPGAILVHLAERVQPDLRAAADLMAALSAKVGETVVMHVADGDDAVVLAQQVAGDNVVRVEHTIGSRHPLTKGASGRALLAYMTTQTIERAIRDDAERLGRQLEVVRQLGYALSHDELQQGVHGLAVPILADGGHPLASLAILVPTSRAGRLAENVEPLAATAAKVSAQLNPSTEKRRT